MNGFGNWLESDRIDSISPTQIADV